MDFGSDDGFGSSEAASLFVESAEAFNAVDSSSAAVSSTMGLDIQSSARILSRLSSSILMPWERGLMSQVFCQPRPIIPFPSLSMVPLPRVAYVQTPVTSMPFIQPINIKRPIVPFVLRKLRSIDVPDAGDANRHKAVNRWRMIIEYSLHSSQVGQQITEMIEDGRSEVLITAVLLDTFAGKRTSTMNKRAASILRYLRWSKLQSSDVQDPLGFGESVCYRYVSFLKFTKASASAAKSFREALNFCMFVLGMPQVQEASKSSRVAGSSTNQLKNKKTLKQATEYKVIQIRLLHHILENAPDDRDRVMAGYDLFTIYGVCRFGDAMNPTKATLDLDENG